MKARNLRDAAAPVFLFSSVHFSAILSLYQQSGEGNALSRWHDL
jgi:hypothetical protein